MHPVVVNGCSLPRTFGLGSAVLTIRNVKRLGRSAHLESGSPHALAHAAGLPCRQGIQFRQICKLYVSWANIGLLVLNADLVQEIPFTQGDSPERNTWICEHFYLTNAKVQANLERYLQMPQIQMEMPKDVSTEAAQLSWMTELAAKRSATGWTHFCTLLHTFNCRVPCVFLDYQMLTDFE